MKTRTNGMIAVMSLVLLAHAHAAWAANPTPTTITVPDMHCMGCVKKMAAKLREVPGVAAVSAHVEATTLQVTAQAQSVPSPRALWEAIEKAGYKPSKLEGPSGRYTAKPQQ